MSRIWDIVQDVLWCGTLMFFLGVDLLIDFFRRNFSKEC